MRGRGTHAPVASLLQATNTLGGYEMSLICTEQGLAVSVAGQGLDSDELAAFTSLFDNIVQRARRDLGFKAVDELTLLDPGRGRFVIRPLVFGAGTTMFLVVQMDPKRTWRRYTNQLASELLKVMAPLAEQIAEQHEAQTQAEEAPRAVSADQPDEASEESP